MNYREIFFAHYGVGPYTCFFCHQEVTFDAVQVHHHDEDRTNNDISNLCPCHLGCHTRHHGTRSPSQASREKLSQTLKSSPAAKARWEEIKRTGRWKGRKRSAEAKAHMSAAQRGKRQTEQGRANMRIAAQRNADIYRHCAECDRDYPLTWVSRHEKATGHSFGEVMTRG